MISREIEFVFHLVVETVYDAVSVFSPSGSVFFLLLLADPLGKCVVQSVLLLLVGVSVGVVGVPAKGGGRIHHGIEGRETRKRTLGRILGC